MTRSPRRSRRGLAVTVAATVLAGCAQAEIRDVVGLWAATDPADVQEATVEIEVVFVEGDAGGCWSAVDTSDDGAPALPVSWPVGTLLGLEATLELPDGTAVAVGDRLRADGAVLPATRASDPPAGCDVDGGFYAVARAAPLDDG